jgi:lysozyme
MRAILTAAALTALAACCDEPRRWPASDATTDEAEDAGAPSNAAMRINDAGLAIIKESEGLRLEAYSDGTRWFIGYGHSGPDVRAGMRITEAQAGALLREDVRGCERAVADVVKVKLNSNEFSALVSLCYNLGARKFAETNVVKKLNAGDRKGAADAFLENTRARIDGELKTLPHLVTRREKERALFLK